MAQLLQIGRSQTLRGIPPLDLAATKLRLGQAGCAFTVVLLDEPAVRLDNFARNRILREVCQSFVRQEGRGENASHSGVYARRRGSMGQRDC